MELLDEYVYVCRMIGGWTDWVQGVGGNISVKQGDEILVKRSGARIGDTTKDAGWVKCSIIRLRECMENNTENTVSAILQGTGTPSIEAFLHLLPARIIVHLHPSHLLNTLCSDVDSFSSIPYTKPGLQLAQQLMRAYMPSTNIYFLKNHLISTLRNINLFD